MKIKKLIPFLFFFILTYNPVGASGLGVGPPSLELQVPVDGYNSTIVYFTSDGLTGELIIGGENLPFKIEPEKVPMNPDDVNTPVEITLYGNSTIEPGIYEGKITFIGMTGGAVAMGIKLKIKVDYYDPNTGFSLFGLNQSQLLIVGALIVLVSIIFIYLRVKGG